MTVKAKTQRMQRAWPPRTAAGSHGWFTLPELPAAASATAWREHYATLLAPWHPIFRSAVAWQRAAYLFATSTSADGSTPALLPTLVMVFAFGVLQSVAEGLRRLNIHVEGDVLPDPVGVDWIQWPVHPVCLDDPGVAGLSAAPYVPSAAWVMPVGGLGTVGQRQTHTHAKGHHRPVGSKPAHFRPRPSASVAAAAGTGVASAASAAAQPVQARRPLPLPLPGGPGGRGGRQAADADEDADADADAVDEFEFDVTADWVDAELESDEEEEIDAQIDDILSGIQ